MKHQDFALNHQLEFLTGEGEGGLAAPKAICVINKWETPQDS